MLADGEALSLEINFYKITNFLKRQVWIFEEFLSANNQNDNFSWSFFLSVDKFSSGLIV